MKMKQALLGIAAMFVFVAASANAQTLQLAIIGSSAYYLELGQASATAQTCYWTDSAKDLQATDSRIGKNDGTSFWVTWSPGTGTCAAPAGSGALVNIYLSADSVVGNRCFFGSPACTITLASGVTETSLTTKAGSEVLGSNFNDTGTTLPTGVYSAIVGASINAAATDIRPEDAEFAMNRVLTTCGTPMATGSQYLGLGYSNGSVISSGTGSAGSVGNFNVGAFVLQGNDPITGDAPTANTSGGWTVTQIGAVPVVVFVNPSNASGFGSLLVSNIDRATLAGFLDGTYGRTSDVVDQAYSTASESPTTVFVREPISGTYNTMEYAIPNSVQNQSSQDVGVQAVNAFNAGLSVPPLFCTGGVGGTYGSLTMSLATARSHSGGSSYRVRAIGTGQEVASVLAGNANQANKDTLGYAFWSAANFANATASNAKYLTVDGVDPLQEVWQDGLVPTAGNGLLGNVTLAHVKDGSYPIWSILRIVTSTANKTVASNLVTEAANFLSPTQPDFVHASTLTIVRSHFAPPGVNFTSANGANSPCNGTNSACAESGGDVGGLVYSIQADGDYNVDNSGASGSGNVGHRQ
jgi:hypothetical protein